MNFLKKTIFIVFLLSNINFSYGQYIGGNGTGFGFTNQIHSTCSSFSENQYLGGSSSGSTFEIKMNTTCSTTSENPYTGGENSGFTSANFIQTICVVSASNPYKGGQNDGYSTSDLINSFCIVNGINPYRGGSNDGFSQTNIINTICSVITANPYKGGPGNGHFATPNLSTYVWEGDDATAPTDWSIAQNWNENIVPSLNTNVTIPFLVSNNYPIITTSADTKCLNISENSILSITPSGNLSVYGKMMCQGELNIQSPLNAGATGSLIAFSDIQGSGMVHFERFYTVANRWQYTTVPFSNVNSDFFTRNTAVFNGYFYQYNESFDLTPNPSEINYLSWNLLSNAWEFAHSGADSPAMALNKGTGYAYRDGNDKLLTFSSQATDLANSDLSFPLTFTFNDDNLAYFDGWNLIGNPYPSAIDWDAFSKSNIQNTIYYWDGNQKKYLYYNGFGGTESGTASNVINGGSRYIPALQAFFVKATASGNFTIPATARVHNNQATWKKSTKNNSDITFFKINAAFENQSDELSVRFFNQATNLFDNEYDAYKIFNNNSPNVFSLNNEIPLALNSLPVFDTTLVVPIGFINNIAGEVTFKIQNNLPDNQNIYIENVTQNTFHLISSAEYRFYYTKPNEIHRFNIYFNEKIQEKNSQNILLYSYKNWLYIQSNEDVSNRK